MRSSSLAMQAEPELVIELSHAPAYCNTLKPLNVNPIY